MTAPLLNVQQIAELLNVKPKWVYADCESPEGTLPFYRIGRFLRFDRAAIDKWSTKVLGGHDSAVSQYQRVVAF